MAPGRCPPREDSPHLFDDNLCIDELDFVIIVGIIKRVIIQANAVEHFAMFFFVEEAHLDKKLVVNHKALTSLDTLKDIYLDSFIYNFQSVLLS